MVAVKAACAGWGRRVRRTRAKGGNRQVTSRNVVGAGVCVPLLGGGSCCPAFLNRPVLGVARNYVTVSTSYKMQPTR